MTPNDYQNESMRTVPERYPVFENIGECQRQILHAQLGIASEAGEVADAIKKYLIYGRTFDEVNIREECGDLLWYIALLLKYTGWSMEECMEHNIAKLKLRYPDKFTEQHALERKDKLNASSFHPSDCQCHSCKPERKDKLCNNPSQHGETEAETYTNPYPQPLCDCEPEKKEDHSKGDPSIFCPLCKNPLTFCQC